MTEASESSRRVADTAGAAGEKLVSAAAAAGLAAIQKGNVTGVASDIADVALEQGRNLLDTARGQATSFADGRKDDAAQSIADLASSLRDSGKTFEGRPNIQAFMGSAAEGLEQLAGGIRQRSFAELYGEAETYAKSRPVAFGAATIAAGFFLARFIKSSAEELAAEASSIRRRAATKASSDDEKSEMPHTVSPASS